MKTGVPIAFLSLATVAVWPIETNRVVRSMTLQACIERALTDNLEIRAERINPSIATWGVVQQEGIFDPAFSASATYNDSSTPSVSGEPLALRQFNPRIGLGGLLPAGTTYGLSLSDYRSGGTGYPDYIYTGTASLNLTQPLLKNFGIEPNLAQIRIARRRRDIAIQQFLLLVMNKVNEVCRAYYELVFAIENHKAKLEDLNRAKRLLEENRKRVQVGVMSPLDVTQAEAGVAEREEAVIVAERAIIDNENALKRLISSDVRLLFGETIVPVDYPVVEMVETDVPRSIRTALERRPDYIAAKHQLERQNILVKYTRNQLWPELDLQASYGMNGWSSSGFHDLTARQLAQDNPAWGVGIAFRLPIGNRQARASYNMARLEREQALLALKQLEQNIIVAVDNAVGRVRTNLKRVEATRAASRLAEESLKAEETKLRAGTSTSFLVLQAQSQLAAARSAEIRARADYSQSLADLALVEGTILSKYNIVVDEKF